MRRNRSKPNTVEWRDPGTSGDADMLRPAGDPFQADGGMRLVEGNLGRACFKSSAVERERWTVEAPCRVFETQHAVSERFRKASWTATSWSSSASRARANGMPELRKLPPLGVLQDRGYRVALVTDGRMSGASGKVPAAIHCTPEALGGGPLSLLRDGDVVRVCAETGELSTTADLSARARAAYGRSDRRGPRTLRDVPHERRWGRTGRIVDAGDGWIMTDLVAVDIGGTHARFVIASVAEDGSISLGEPETLHTKDHASFQTAWEDFRERCGGSLPPRAALSVAGPVGGEVIRFTNNPWIIRLR